MIEVTLEKKKYPVRFTLSANKEISKKFADGEKITFGDGSLESSLYICAVGLKYGALVAGGKPLTDDEYINLVDGEPVAFREITTEFISFSKLLKIGSKNGVSPKPKKENA
jgi:hypothetical protein